MKMKFLNFIIFIVGVVQGQHYGDYKPQGNQYVPVIKDGVPEDTPEVKAAKAAHFEAYERARALAAKNPSDGQYEEVNPKQQQYQQVTNEKPQYQQQQYQTENYQPQQYQTQQYQPQQYQLQQYQTQQYQPQQYQAQQHQARQNQQLQYQTNVIYSQPKQQLFEPADYSSVLPLTRQVQLPRNLNLAILSQAQTQRYRYRRGLDLDSRTETPKDIPEVQAARYKLYVTRDPADNEDDDDLHYAPQEVKAGNEMSKGHSELAPNTPEVYVNKVQHGKFHTEESTKHNQLGSHGERYKI